jgi:hypothetical protein
MSYRNTRCSKYSEPCHATLLTNWEQMAHGADNYCLLLTNHKETPINESHYPPCNIILCRCLQVNYFSSFQTLSAVKHDESSGKSAWSSRPAMHLYRWSAEPWTRLVIKNIPCTFADLSVENMKADTHYNIGRFLPLLAGLRRCASRRLVNSRLQGAYEFYGWICMPDGR